MTKYSENLLRDVSSSFHLVVGKDKALWGSEPGFYINLSCLFKNYIYFYEKKEICLIFVSFVVCPLAP